MQDRPECPACGATTWEPLGSRTYRSQQAESFSGNRRRAMQTLFELWAPGRQEFRVEFVGCADCGMLIYRPRPTVVELEAKYSGSSASLGDAAMAAPETAERQVRRATRLHEILAPHVRPRAGEPARVLDYGGGDGRLLTGFVDDGDQCDIIDYVAAPVPGVRHVGRNESDLPADAEYDAIVCSHVVEHLAEPAGILRSLRSLLASTGVIYVEVPVEMLGMLPAPDEPVTHVNFFTPQSLRTLLETCGYRTITCTLRSYPHPNGGLRLCASAVATPASDQPVTRSGLRPLKAYLKPSLRWVKAATLLAPDTPRVVRRMVARIGR